MLKILKREIQSVPSATGLKAVSVVYFLTGGESDSLPFFCGAMLAMVYNDDHHSRLKKL